MIKCLFCGNIVLQSAGKRKKEYCNNTCRSNFWYNKNKKGKSLVKDLTKPNKEVKPAETPKTNYVADTRKPFMSEAIKKKLGIN